MQNVCLTCDVNYVHEWIKSCLSTCDPHVAERMCKFMWIHLRNRMWIACVHVSLSPCEWTLRSYVKHKPVQSTRRIMCSSTWHLITHDSTCEAAHFAMCAIAHVQFMWNRVFGYMCGHMCIHTCTHGSAHVAKHKITRELHMCYCTCGSVCYFTCVDLCECTCVCTCG